VDPATHVAFGSPGTNVDGFYRSHREAVGAARRGRRHDTRRLAATLKAFLEERSSPRRTAQRLGVHENTIKNRIRTAEELRGHTADERVAETLVALRLARVVGPLISRLSRVRAHGDLVVHVGDAGGVRRRCECRRAVLG
jgi:hypothetical protein